MQDFTLFAFPAALRRRPGRDSGQQRRAAAHIMAMDPRDHEGTCVIRVEDAAFESLQLTCQEFHGALLVTNRSGSKHFVVVDGLRFELHDGIAGRWDVGAIADVRTTPSGGLVTRIKDSLEFSMVFAEAWFGQGRSGSASVAAVRT